MGCDVIENTLVTVDIFNAKVQLHKLLTPVVLEVMGLFILAVGTEVLFPPPLQAFITEQPSTCIMLPWLLSHSVADEAG